MILHEKVKWFLTLGRRDPPGGIQRHRRRTVFSGQQGIPSPATKASYLWVEIKQKLSLRHLDSLVILFTPSHWS